MNIFAFSMDEKFRLGYIKIVKILILSKADIDITDNAGYSALSWAGFIKNYKIIEILLLAGAEHEKSVKCLTNEDVRFKIASMIERLPHFKHFVNMVHFLGPLPGGEWPFTEDILTMLNF